VQQPTLLACSVAFPAALLALVAAVDARAHPVLVLALAYSLESVLIELIFIVGPMIVALFVATASAAAAVLFAAAAGSTGTWLFLRLPGAGGHRPLLLERVRPSRDRHDRVRHGSWHLPLMRQSRSCSLSWAPA